jgi:SAM-dependent methyltransferase
MSASYFDCYTKNPTGDAQAIAALVYRSRWRLLEGASEVLDVGFGAGGFLDAAPPGTDARGVDSDPEAVARKADAAVLGSAEDLPFPDNTFDGVHAAHVIEHLQSPERLVEESARVLRAGGRLLVVTPDIERCGFDFWADHTHRQPFTRRSIERLLTMSGFDIVHLGHGLARQTRLEEFAAHRLGLSVPRRFALRAALGRHLGAELVAVGRLGR